MKVAVSILVLSFLFHGKSGKAQQNGAIDDYLLGVYKNHVIPGFAVVVAQKDKIIFSKGYGVERLGSAKPFTPQTVTGIGSLTKSMTTIAILQLVEQKKVDLDKPVVYYLPWFRTANKERSDKITVRMLLNNTSGLYAGSPSLSDETTENSLEDFVKSLASVYLTREPGLSYLYSNAGFSVAGLIISKVSGLPYPLYLNDKVFLPLKMLHTSTDPRDFRKLKVTEGHYYGINKAIPAERKNSINPDGYIPAGSLMSSSAEDLGNYLLGLMATNGNKVISGSNRNTMWKQNISFPGLTHEDGGEGTEFGYGLGWMISTIEGRHVIHHGGSTGKTSSFTMIDPQSGMGAVILMNLDLSFINKYEYPTESNIINNIMRIAMGLPPSKYGVPTEKDPTLNNYTLSNGLIGHYTGNYLLKSDNVVFLYTGTQLQINKTSTDQMDCKIYRGEQIINQFTADFVNESLAVSRNIGSPIHLRFKLNPEGNVSGLFFDDMEFIREDSIAGSRYKMVFQPGNKISFRLPVSWNISWQKNSFSAQSADGLTQLKGSVSMDSTASSPESSLEKAIHAGSKMETGLLHTENFGTHVWKEKSYRCTMNGELKQVIVMQSKMEGNTIEMILISKEGNLTGIIQDLVTPLLNSVNVLF